MHIQRLITVFDVETEQLPSELRESLTVDDRKAIEAGGDYFVTLADRAEFDWLKKIFQACAESGTWHLEFYGVNTEPYVPYFRFNWGGSPALCLPRQAALPSDLPAVLRHLYSLVGGFQENEFGYAGGVFRVDEFPSVRCGIEWVVDGEPINPEHATPFLSTLSGRNLCFLRDGGAAWWENGEFRRVNLEEELAAYFNALLEGSRI